MGKIIRGIFGNKKPACFKLSVIIAAGGTGSRMNLGFNKVFLSVADKPILAYTMDAFEGSPLVDEIILVHNENNLAVCKDIVEEFGYTKVKTIVCGGKTRRESVYNGLMEVSPDADVVMIHDAARPLVTGDIIRDVAETAFSNGAAAAGITPVDTVKEVKDGLISKTIDRSSLVLIQTPQAFKKDIILKAHQNPSNPDVTDDCMLVEALGQKISVVQSSSCNMKLTTPSDLVLIGSVLSMKEDFE